MIPTVIQLQSEKGGTGKTSLVSHLSSLLAASGWRVLAVDLDPQGNLVHDLGYLDRSDGGANLFAAIVGDDKLEPVAGVRPGLDVIAGGPALRDFTDWLAAEARAGRPHRQALENALLSVAGDYDVIFFDTPPTTTLLHETTSYAAHYLLITTQADRASIDGIGGVFRVFLQARPTNPDLEILGVVLTRFDLRARAELRAVTDRLRDLLGDDVPLLGVIREAGMAAIHLRDRNQTAVEYHEAASVPFHLRRKRGDARRFSKHSAGLAADYDRVATAVVERFNQRQTAFAARLAHQ
jgi:cellulose biosynthesis protein BcsQ